MIHLMDRRFGVHLLVAGLVLAIILTAFAVAPAPSSAQNPAQNEGSQGIIVWDPAEFSLDDLSAERVVIQRAQIPF